MFVQVMGGFDFRLEEAPPLDQFTVTTTTTISQTVHRVKLGRQTAAGIVERERRGR